MDTPESHCQCQLCELEAAGLGAEAYLASIVERISETGWAIQAVPDEERGLSWAYTVGLWHSFHAPEMSVFGLPQASMAQILTTLAGHAAAGARFEPGDRIDGAGPPALALRPVDPSWRLTSLLAISDTIYGLLPPPYLQVVWPDRNGILPGERGFESRLEGAQPMLWLPRADNPPSTWARIDDADQPT